MVEVAISMTLFAIGAAAVVAMERTSVQGDADARQQDVATQIAFDWVARLQRDAFNWRVPTPTAPTGDTRDANTVYLNNSYVSQLCGGPDGGSTTYTPSFILPGTVGPRTQTLTGNVDGRSYAFDMFGRDRIPGSLNPSNLYCVQVAECFQDSTSSPNATPPGQKLIQATVRVVWPRKINAAVDPNFCSSPPTFLAAVDQDGGADAFRAVSMTVLLQGGAGQ